MPPQIPAFNFQKRWTSGPSRQAALQISRVRQPTCQGHHEITRFSFQIQKRKAKCGAKRSALRAHFRFQIPFGWLHKPERTWNGQISVFTFRGQRHRVHRCSSFKNQNTRLLLHSPRQHQISDFRFPKRRLPAHVAAVRFQISDFTVLQNTRETALVRIQGCQMQKAAQQTPRAMKAVCRSVTSFHISSYQITWWDMN